MLPPAMFASCLPGLEALLVGELRALGAEPRPAGGTVHFAGDRALLLAACLRLGTATQVYLQCGDFHCRSLGELERKTAALPWRDWLRPTTPLVVQAKARKSRLYHTGAIEERVRLGIGQALGIAAPPAPPPPAAPDGTEAVAAQLAVRFFDDHCTLALASAATPLHRRGFRLQTGKAPLREDLAFALLLAAGWRPGIALLDPLCGSGTIVIEAAAVAAGLPPGRLRPMPFAGTELGCPRVWQEVLAQAVQPAVATPIAASDRDAGAILAAQQNAERAGVGGYIAFTCCALAAQPWLADPSLAPRPGMLVTNPPFGRRIGQADKLLPLYQTLGHRLLRLGSGFSATVLAHDPRLARRSGIPFGVAFAARHGGLSVTALRQEVATASAASAPPAAPPQLH